MKIDALHRHISTQQNGNVEKYIPNMEYIAFYFHIMRREAMRFDHIVEYGSNSCRETNLKATFTQYQITAFSLVKV